MQQFQDIDQDIERNNNVVRWIDQNEDESISKPVTKPNSKKDIEHDDISKVSIHRRLPSSKLKPIIKYTNNTGKYENNVALFKSNAVTPNNINMGPTASQFQDSQR